MATIFTTDKITVRVYANDHLPPHFHIVTPDHEAVVRIADLVIIAGEISLKTRKKVWNMIIENKAAITAEWNRINPRFPIA